jgi:hypothetical protein
MILYVNGDSHAAAAECVNPHAWACDDSMYWGLAQQPHPDNLRASFGCELANCLNAILVCEAQAGGSNTRILRTTRDWISANPDSLADTFVLIQWSTWEREEWFHAGTWWQVNASGLDHVPSELQEKYRHYIVGLDWESKTQQAHNDLWVFHQELKQKNIRHLFFNGNNSFDAITDRQDWDNQYLSPYNSAHTYNAIIRQNGYQAVAPDSWHFGPDAHSFWAQYVHQYLNDNKLV